MVEVGFKQYGTIGYKWVVTAKGWNDKTGELVTDRQWSNFRSREEALSWARGLCRRKTQRLAFSRVKHIRPKSYLHLLHPIFN
jgi:hypothetical protein